MIGRTNPEDRSHEPFGEPCYHGVHSALGSDILVTVCAKCLEDLRNRVAMYEGRTQS